MAAHFNIIGFSPRHTSKFQEMLQIPLTDRLSLLDRSIHLRLSEERLITFVVSEPPVTPHVDNDVAFKGPPEVRGKTNDLRHSLRIFAVHVEYRNLQHFGDVAGVHTGLRF